MELFLVHLNMTFLNRRHGTITLTGRLSVRLGGLPHEDKQLVCKTLVNIYNSNEETAL